MRFLIYGCICIVIAFGITEKVKHDRFISQFKKGQERLDIYLREDSRFTNVYVSFFPPQSKVFILAYGLPTNAQNDLERLVTNTFNPIPVKITYKDVPLVQQTNQPTVHGK